MSETPENAFLYGKAMAMARYKRRLIEETVCLYSENAQLREERDQAYEALHFANGTAELALKHRDEAESLLREIGKTWANNDDLTEVMKRADDYLNGPFLENACQQAPKPEPEDNEN